MEIPPLTSDEILAVRTLLRTHAPARPGPSGLVPPKDPTDLAQDHLWRTKRQILRALDKHPHQWVSLRAVRPAAYLRHLCDDAIRALEADGLIEARRYVATNGAQAVRLRRVVDDDLHDLL